MFWNITNIIIVAHVHTTVKHQILSTDSQQNTTATNICVHNNISQLMQHFHWIYCYRLVLAQSVNKTISYIAICRLSRLQITQS